jgi:hypothetical protein
MSTKVLGCTKGTNLLKIRDAVGDMQPSLSTQQAIRPDNLVEYMTSNMGVDSRKRIIKKVQVSPVICRLI